MKKLIVPLLVILTVILAACGGGGSSSGNGGVSQQGLSSGNSYINCPGSPNTTAAASTSSPVTLTVSGFSSSPAEDALVQQNLNNFTKLHPNIHINWSPIPGDYPTKMRANVASGTVPDVFYLTPGMSSEYISSGKLLNLSPYMGKDGVKASDYYSALNNPFTCTSGQVYGLPKDWNSLGVFYNKQMFQAAGLPFPTANWTWDDLKNDAQKLTKNPGAPNSVYGISLSADASRWGAFLLANGGSVLNKDGTQATFNNQVGIDTLNYYASFLRNNTGTLPTSVGAPWNGDALGKQRAAMAIEGGWLIPYMASTYPNVQYDIAPLPMSPTGKRANLTFTNAWSAYSGTKNPSAPPLTPQGRQQLRRGIQGKPGRSRRDTLTAYLFLAPYLFVLVVFLIITALYGIGLSFFTVDIGFTAPQFVGFQNYQRLFSQLFTNPSLSLFWISMVNILKFVVVVVIGQTILALVLALILQVTILGKGTFRTIFYIPAVTSSVATALIFLWLYNPNGLINYVLSLVHINGPDWLNDPLFALPALMLLNIWTTAAGFMIYFMAALQDLPKELMEAPSIDGASRFQTFRYITVPLLRPTIFPVVALGTIGAFQMFDQAKFMTNGGPLNSTLTPCWRFTMPLSRIVTSAWRRRCRYFSS